MQCNPDILKHLELTTAILPIPLYWLDTRGNILGCNEALLQEIGMKASGDLVGKPAANLYSAKISHSSIEENIQVITTGITRTHEEAIKNSSTGESKYFNAVKAPLRNNNGNIIGLIATLTHPVTQKKIEYPAEKTKLLEDMDKIISLVPTPIYWEDVNSVIIGANKTVISELGVQVLSDYVGKSLYDLYPKEMAEHIKQHNEEVMSTGKVMSQEESIVNKRGELRYYIAVKAPLYDDHGNIMGIIGTSIDITQQKEAERLRLQSEIQLQHQEKFTKLANQVAHDIRSPLASLVMIVKECTHIPESDRVALREAAMSIGDIANHLLHQYQKKDKADATESEERHPILVSAVLLETLSAKKYQYGNLPIKFDCHFQENTQFAFVKIGPSAFKRMLSNLINNAVDAFDQQPGEIDLQLEANNEWVKISIQDNGKGMSTELIDKIMRKTAVTEGKKSGHGIGLTQVWETLEHNHGEMHIASELNKGTTITLTFPRVKAPYWIAEEINLSPSDTVIILDDDTSIHGAWRARFESILSENTLIQLKHFQLGKEALEFIQSLAAEEKKKIFLLSDYELLKQDLNGLHVIAQSDINRSILVTSHYVDPLVQNQAAKTGTKILPKQLASEIVIAITKTDSSALQSDIPEKVDAVIVDDDKAFVRSLSLYAFDDDQITDEYYNPEHFLKNVDKYPKDTKIYLDNNYATSELKGLDVAKQLHELGYTRLYLLSGEDFKKGTIPDYLTVIGKNDIARLKKL